MMQTIEHYLKNLKITEKIMLIIVLFLVSGYGFYQYVYLSFEDDSNFLLLQELSNIQKAKGVKKLTQTMSIKKIKAYNSKKKQDIKNYQKKLENIDTKLDNHKKIDLNYLAKTYNIINDNNTTTITLHGDLKYVLKHTDFINQHFKIDYFRLYTNDAGENAVLMIDGKISNPTKKRQLLSLASPFFSPNNIVELAGIIGKSAKINSKWFFEEDNISSTIKLLKINVDSIKIIDINNKIKIIKLFH